MVWIKVSKNKSNKFSLSFIHFNGLSLFFFFVLISKCALLSSGNVSLFSFVIKNIALQNIHRIWNNLIPRETTYSPRYFKIETIIIVTRIIFKWRVSKSKERILKFSCKLLADLLPRILFPKILYRPKNNDRLFHELEVVLQNHPKK